MLGNSYFGFSGDGNSGGTISGGGTLNYIALFTPSGSQIGDSIMNQVIDPDDGATTDVQIAGNFIPDSTLSARKLGASTRRWDTIFLASNIDYSSDLLYKSGGSTYFRMSTTGNLFLADNKNIDVEASGSKIFNLGIQNAEVINIGTGITPKVINVGSATTLLDDINIYGNVFNQQVTNLLVKDKLFTVNDGGAATSGFNAGFEIEEGGVNTGWFMTNTTRDGWDFKAPAITGVATLGLDLLTANRTAKIQDASGTLAYLSDITGAISGTLNYVAMFTPTGNAVGNAPIKIGSTVTRSAPINGGTNAIAIGYDSTLVGADNYSLGYGITHDGSSTFLVGHTVSIDATSTTYGIGNVFSLGSVFTITGGAFVDSVVNLGFANTINATSETRGVYILGDSHTCTDFVTFCTLIGESCSFTRTDHSTTIGIFNNFTDVSIIYNYGESNTIDTSNTIINFGSNNFISGSTNLSVFGSGNTITDSDKLYIGNSNNNMVVDGLTGFVGIQTTTPTDTLQVGAVAGVGTMNMNGGSGYGSTFSVRSHHTVGYTLDYANSDFTRLFLRGGQTGSGAGTNASVEIMTRLGLGSALECWDVDGKLRNVVSTGYFGDPYAISSRTDISSVGSDGLLSWTDTSSYINIDSDKGLGYANPFLLMNTSTLGSVKISSYGISYFDGGDLVVGDTSATARLQTVGVDATLANYAFKAQDNIGNDLFNVRNDGSIGVGVLASVGRFHTFGMLSDINQRLEPVTGVTEDVSGATVNTTDATTTTLQTITIPTDTIYMIEARITCKKTSGAGVGTVGDGNGYIRTAVYANIGGVVTISGALQTSFTGEGIGAFNATFTISGTNVLVRVTGAANDNVTWNTITRIERVG